MTTTLAPTPTRPTTSTPGSPGRQLDTYQAPLTEAAAAALLAMDIDAAAEHAHNAKADNTRRAYKADWLHFVAWCDRRQINPLPATAEIIAAYAAHMADKEGYKLSTIRRRLATISQAHQYAGHESPLGKIAIRETMRGLAKKYRTAQEGKAALVTDDIKAIIQTIDTTTISGQRDAAILLVGFAGAFRRSELVALQRGDVDIKRDGMLITVKQSKTDQLGEGMIKAIPYGKDEKSCPVRALKRWLKTAAIGDTDKTAPLFMPVTAQQTITRRQLHDRTVARLVQKYAAAAGYDPRLYAGHSLRAGFVTAALEAGADLHQAMKQTGHTSERVARKYDRGNNLLKNSAAGRLGL